MSHAERYPPDDPREWLNRARSNLALAKNRISDAYLEDLCFEAQQASEKAIKATLIVHRIEFPFVHDLTLLLSMLEENGIAVPDTVRRAGRLNRYAVATRYPGVASPVSLQEYADAVETAEAVVEWAVKRAERSLPTSQSPEP